MMPGATFIQGDRVNLRTIEEEDVEFLRDNINDPEIRVFINSKKPKNLEQEKEFFQNVICEDDEVNLAICRDRKIIGIISLIPEDEEEVAEIGIWISTDHHGEGYGTEASELIVDYAFQELRYHKLKTRALASNRPSQRIWEKLGFEKEGELREQVYRDGSFEDTYIYGLLEQEWN